MRIVSEIFLTRLLNILCKFRFYFGKLELNQNKIWFCFFVPVPTNRCVGGIMFLGYL